jgi:hypothetical protein
MTYHRFHWLAATWWPLGAVVAFQLLLGFAFPAKPGIRLLGWLAIDAIMAFACRWNSGYSLRTIHCPHCHTMPRMGASDGPLWFVGVCPACHEDTREAVMEIRFGRRR